ncbi:GNAT family N-acetyltransferase [Clostridium sp. FP2]|uniref:GNAT family N-acetyltransferase n=1 Tax=Clostridium sp. FP2 TaxID=2724481 RepID=UPI0013E96C9F|nr:GNAT family N-acetyltransferase [Clostridium sp. FP2]MBZ9622541.1 GNAT family N-acetyltransferase [Clostridium sp. FP2]
MYNLENLNFGGELESVLVRYFNAFMVYSKGDYDLQGYVELINNKDFSMLVEKTEVILKFEGTSLQLDQPEQHHFAVLNDINSDFVIEETLEVKIATLDDIAKIVRLKNTIKEFSNGNKKFKEILINNIKSGTTHVYFIECDGKIVSYAQTSAENSISAMVLSVMTDRDYRGKGFASACIKMLCDDMIAQGKTLCLFYRNPKAGAIYRRLGFKDIGFWSMYPNRVI